LVQNGIEKFAMKAIALHRPLPIDDPQALVDLELPKPAPSGRGLG